MKNIFFLSLILILSPFRAFSQDEVLLTIDGKPVYKSEFERIYHKNSNIEGYDNKTPAEYLDMFINFKLKVLEARKLGYDTLHTFTAELAGYRDQLARPYLQDKTQIDRLVREAYDRTVKEVNTSHIMIKLPANPTPEDTLKAYNKAIEIRKRVAAGEQFEKIARTESDDPSARVNLGSLGWFSAFTMVFPFENAAYNTPVGGFSMPVRSKYGYHIIRVNAFRDALGEIKLAHIMIRKASNDEQNTNNEEKIKACYQALKNGSKFSDMVKQYSEDAGTVRNNGQMRWLRSGELPADIEKGVFALKDSGEFTAPIKSEYGWHIFQLQGKRPIGSFEKLKPQLEEKVLLDERGKMTESNFVERLKKEYNFRSYPENMDAIAGEMDSSVYNGTWDPSMTNHLIEPVFAIGNNEYSQKDLVAFILKTKRYNRKESYQAIVSRKCNELAENELMNYEKSRLEEKYPQFRYLMEEYHDGILLFNIMDNKVWARAVSDTAGLTAYYKSHADEYKWKERADISIYTVKNPADVKTVTSLAKKRIKNRQTADAFIRTACKSDTIECVLISDEKIEKDEKLPLGGFTWKKGTVKTVPEKNDVKIVVVNAILPPAQKLFSETQGQVTADYQNYLDKQWIESLRAEHKISVNQDVLNRVK
jgi:peptidyl-prolyl cis-trans isomerase SurA